MDFEGKETTTTQPPLLRRLIVGRNPARTLARILILVVVSFIVFKFVLVPIRVTGNSMFPTYKNGRVNFINRFSYLRSAPQRGDIVSVQFAGPKVLLLKRIIGMPGETVHIADGGIYIDGELLEEPYAHGRIPWSYKPQKLEPHQYFVIGDNRPISDMALKYDYQIIGKILF